MKIFNLYGDDWDEPRDRDIVEHLDTGKVYAASVAGEPIMLARPGPTVEYWEGEE